MIEIADRCNEVCIHCYQVQGQKGEMSTEEIFRVLEELAEMGVLFLTLSGGEPTLRSDFLQIVERARELKFAVKVYSNGLRVDEKMASALAKLAIQEFQTSLYSPRPEIHDWVTNVPGSFTKTVNAVKALRSRGVPVVVKSPLMNFNVDDYDAHIALIESLGADYQFDDEVYAREGGELDPTALRIGTEQRTKVRQDERLGEREKPGKAPPSLSGSTCGACSGNVHIEANGEMRPCTLLEVPVGHALDPNGLRSAYYEDPSAKGIRDLTWGDHHGCRECEIRAYCQRCFANARKESGDALGPYASACRKAITRFQLAHERPKTESTPASNVDLGPFRILESGQLERIDYEITENDRALREKLPWIIKDISASGPAPVANSALVQIRRPSRRGSAKPESVPTNLFLSTAPKIDQGEL